MTFSSVLNIVLVAFAFGFVIFWHELGHFLAARWAGVRVEQFAVGMGQAIFSWRKGIGIRPGNTQAEFDRRVDEEIAKRGTARPANEYSLRERYDIAEQIGLGQTDYRINWIPLGGYVKPTGQDDLRPAQQVGADDPHSFGAKPVGKRMVIIAAGVVMNVILAFALYVALFLYGFNAPPTVIGQVLPGSPAAAAGLKPGDRIVAVDGKEQQDFNKFRMNTALLRSGEPAVFTVDRPGEGVKNVQVVPAKSVTEYGMSSVGIAGASTLEAPTGIDADDKMIMPELAAMPAKSRIIKVGDVDVSQDKDARRLVEAVAAANGRPVDVTIKHGDGTEQAFAVQPSLVAPFNAVPKTDNRTFAGMQPRVRVIGVQRDKPAAEAGLKPGDVIEQLTVIESGFTLRPPSMTEFIATTSQAGAAGKTLSLTVMRDGQVLPPITLKATKIDGQFRMGVMPDLDLGTPVVALVLPDSPAAAAKIEVGQTIVRVGGKSVASWPDVLAALRAAGDTVDLTTSDENGEHKTILPLNSDAKTALANLTFAPTLSLAPLIEPRHTTNPLVAATWGYEETKASILQVYVTLRRLIEGQVPLSNLNGPVGIFSAGTSAASRGIDWLIWFTALISANLAVVNFLPIPIVDGGLFVFLLSEKFTGRPPSPRLQTAAQIVGIVLLGSLFLFVTYHDILRQIG